MKKDLVTIEERGTALWSTSFADRFSFVFDNFQKLFDEFWKSAGGLEMRIFEDIQTKGSFPKMNVVDNPDNYEVEIAVAGFTKEEVDLEFKDNTLFIKAEHSEDTCDDGTKEECKKYLRREIAHRSFRRALRFPEEVNINTVDCNFKDGIITFKINKEVLPEPEVKKIEIK